MSAYNNKHQITPNSNALGESVELYDTSKARPGNGQVSVPPYMEVL
jgi:hypothetical protein